ncbi:MAG: chitobiase/beta-hexosaminidase C-terminal domain-containing protein, partial [Oscillospiraceae bacterium]
DSTVPIVITKPTWIIAIAERSGVLSKPTLNEYTVATQLPDPYASLKTGSVVYKGTRIRLNGSGNLAFTVDGSDPKAALAAQQTPVSTDKDAKKAEVLYGDSVVIDAEYGKSVTIRAFAYGEGRSPSNTVSFTYTVCDKDAYLTAAPAAGSVVTSGDNITLTTGISGGMVFYSVGSNTPTLINRFEDDRYNDDWTDADWDDDYTHYQWRNGSSTRKGNSVKVTGEPGSTFTVKATAAANGSEGGTTGVFTYSIRSRTSAPTASIPSGAVVFDGAAVTLSAQEGDIFYTTDGTAPSTSSRLYSAPIPVTGSMVLKAIAVAKDKVESNAVEYIYSYADQAFAPSMSLPGGEIEQGSRIELSTQTEGATIYYSTNGVDPTKESTLYTSPIIVMRPVTIKSIAMRKDLRDSAVNSASYTVIEPELPPMDETDSTGKPQTTLDSLVSRRTYFDENSGPRFTDVIINDPETSTVLSANEGNVSKRAKLVVKQINSSDSDQEAVRNALGYQIVTLYDVSLVQDGEKVQPQGEVEIGIPIPGDYQNGVVTICRVGVDNTVEEYKPRRSGNNAYITVEGNLDRYAVTVPAMSGNISGRLSGWQIALICGAGVLFAGGIGLS